MFLHRRDMTSNRRPGGVPTIDSAAPSTKIGSRLSFRLDVGWAVTPWRRSVETSNDSYTKAQELRSFLFLSVVMAPVLAGIIVAGWGFLVWMYQLVAGPPGG